MKQLTYVIAILATAYSNIYAQHTCRGFISLANGQAMEGVNIVIPELHEGTYSNETGQYMFENLPAGTFKIQYSFVGYENKIVSINTASDSIIKIVMLPTVINSEEIVVSGGQFSSQHENAIKIENYHLHKLEISDHDNIMTALTEIPGVGVISKTSGIATPVIRGLSTSNILVLNNGIKLESYQFSQDHPYLMDENTFKDVELIKGPASLLYGSDAIGGVVNFIKDYPAPQNSTTGTVTGKGFSNTSGLNASFKLKTSQKNYNLGISGSLNSHADYLMGDGAYVPNSRFNRKNISIFAGTKTRKTSYKFFYDYSELNAGMPTLEAIVRIDERGRDNDFWYQNLQHHLLSFKNAVYLSKWVLNNTATIQHNKRQLNGFNNLVNMQLSTFSLNSNASYNFGSGSNLIAGLQSNYQLNTNNEAPVHVLPDYSMVDIAGFGLVKHAITNKLFMQVGARYDYRKIEAPEQEKAAHSHEEEHGDEEHEELMPGLNRDFGNYSLSAGLTWEAMEHALFRLNVASAYRTPNLAELTQDGEHGIRYEVGDRNLNSQRNYEIDASFHYHSNVLFGEFSGYYNYIDDYIFLAPTNAFTDENFPIFRYNQANSTIYGFEASLDVQLMKFLKMGATYAYISAQQSNGSSLPLIPHNKLRPSLSFSKSGTKAIEQWFMRWEMPYAFKQVNPAQFETETQAYTLVNATFGFELKTIIPKAQLKITVRNLLDESYIDHLSTLKELGYKNPGRNIIFSMEVPF